VLEGVPKTLETDEGRSRSIKKAYSACREFLS
jgi:hypothetical protein